MLNAAVVRATNRADTLKKLQNAFGGESKKSSAAKKEIETAPSSSSQSKKRVAEHTPVMEGKDSNKIKMHKVKAVESIMGSIGLDDSNTRRFLTDALEGRSIVLANTKNQINAAKGSTRAISQFKRQKRASNTYLKKHKLLNPFACPTREDLVSIHNLWMDFISQLTSVCSSDAQFQARFNTTGLLGARIQVNTAKTVALYRCTSLSPQCCNTVH